MGLSPSSPFWENLIKEERSTPSKTIASYPISTASQIDSRQEPDTKKALKSPRDPTHLPADRETTQHPSSHRTHPSAVAISPNQRLPTEVPSPTPRKAQGTHSGAPVLQIDRSDLIDFHHTHAQRLEQQKLQRKQQEAAAAAAWLRGQNEQKMREFAQEQEYQRFEEESRWETPRTRSSVARWS